MVTYADIANIFGTGLGPVFGSNPYFIGVVILLSFMLAFAMWGMPLIASTFLGIGVVLILALYGGMIPDPVFYLAIFLGIWAILRAIFRSVQEQ